MMSGEIPIPKAADGGQSGWLPESVLIAEDDLLIARSVRDLVAELGVRVVGMAQNGAKALELAAETKPQAALVDIRMPVMDGIEAAERLWSEMGIPSILLTAYGAEEFVRRAAGIPVFGYVLKPPTAENLRSALCVGWANARARMALQAAEADLRRTLEHRKLTERAKWRLVEVAGMSEPDAHLALQRAARSARKPLVEIAEQVIAAEDPVAAVRVPTS
jgi:response regulator NasT